MKRATLLSVLTLILVLSVVPASRAESHESHDLAQVIQDRFAYIRENLSDPTGDVSKHGALQFYSSGGLLRTTASDAPPDTYDSFNIHAKHIEVIALSDDSAIAMYYAEGSMTPKGYSAVANYLTRVMEVYVKEEGAWVLRAAHWSKLQGGSGTSQTGE